MNIKQIHDVILFYLNKAQQGMVTHAEIDSVLDRAQMATFNKYHANPRVFSMPGKKDNMGYGDSLRMDDALAPFKRTYTFTTGDTASGIITLPSNYMHMIAIRTTQFNNTLNRNVSSAVEVLNEEELIERLESQVLPVSLDEPICILQAPTSAGNPRRVQLFPEQPQSGVVYYFKRPAVPVFAYTQVGRVITYDPIASVQLEWNEADINNIIVEALSYYGLNLQSTEIIQFAENKIAQGQ